MHLIDSDRSAPLETLIGLVGLVVYSFSVVSQPSPESKPIKKTHKVIVDNDEDI